MPTLAAMYRYPVKSTAGEALSRATVGEEGLLQDRRFMVVKPDGSFMTARQYPGLQRACARFDGERLWLTHDNEPAITESRDAFTMETVQTRVWADEFSGLSTTMRLDAWFSRILGEPVRLLWLGMQSPRYRSKINARVSFADGYPLLLTTEASLADLNARTEASHVMAQFRPSVVVAGTEAYAEDAWRRIRIGNVVFRVAAPCARCIMITVDPARGERRSDGEPLRTLAAYRRGKDNRNNIYFGQNLVPENTGTLNLGDTIEVLE